jgi:hypothetical protein
MPLTKLKIYYHYLSELPSYPPKWAYDSISEKEEIIFHIIIDNNGIGY